MERVPAKTGLGLAKSVLAHDQFSQLFCSPSWYRDAAAPVPVAGAFGVAETLAEGALSPEAFKALTRYQYVVPLVRPESVMARAVSGLAVIFENGPADVAARYRL